MYGKLIFAAVLVAFLYVQLGASLECHSCRTPNGCKGTSKITCNRQHANNTRDHLNTYFQGLNTVYSDNFNCLYQNYTQNNQLNMTYMGCVYRNSNPCSLQLNVSYNTLAKDNCTECAGNYCNYKGSAGSYSISAFTVMTTVLAALMAKSFAF